MVKFWPFRKGDESFEKVLSGLSAKIQNGESRVTLLRLRRRRWRALLTLYIGLAYTLYLLVMLLVVPWRDWNLKSASGLIIVPCVIFGLRTILNWYFDRLIVREEASLESLRVQQREKIEELKKKTNFYTTQSMLERYGATPQGTPTRSNESPIQSPQLRERHTSGGLPLTPNNVPADTVAAQTQISKEPEHPKWYDRILDAIVGQDESTPANRYALICRNCKSHNGLAPLGETSDAVDYVCPHCGFLNSKLKQRPHSAPSSNSDVPSLNVNGKESENTEVVAGEDFISEDSS